MTHAELFAKYKALNVELDLVVSEIKSRSLGWQYLIDNNMKVQAMLAYRDEKKCTLSEAKMFIDNYLVESIVDAVVNHGVSLEAILKNGK